MARYWPSSFFFHVYKLGKKGERQYPDILTKQNWSIKDLLYIAFGKLFFTGNTVGSPEWARYNVIWFYQLG